MDTQQTFFRQIMPLLDGLDTLQLVVSKQDETIIVSVLPKSKDVKDKAVGQIPPLIVSGSPLELDTEFFTTIQAPIQKVTGLFTTLKTFEDSVEEARKNSDMEKKKKDEEKKQADKVKKEIEENDKKVKESITEAEAEVKEKPESALKKLEDLQKKSLKLSPKVTASLEKALADVKKAQPQTSLFGKQ